MIKPYDCIYFSLFWKKKPELKASTEKIAPNFMRLFIKQKIPSIISSDVLREGEEG
jgi:hypothetical protein